MTDPFLLQNISEDELNSRQKYALELMKRGKNIFLTGQAGTGKSYTLRAYVKWCIQNNIKYAITSTTGVSALLIGGTTLHSWAGILMGMEDKISLLERVMSRDKSHKRWLYTKVLIIDEISMMPPSLLEKLDYIGKKVRKSTKPFGGIQLIFCGDFAQLPPVQSDFCFKSAIWDLLIDCTIYLTDNMRQTQDVFKNMLSEVRLGNVTPHTIKLLETRLGALIETPEGIVPTKLFSHRATVSKINQDSLLNLVNDKNPLVTYQSKDDVRRKDGHMVDPRYRDQYLGRIDKIFQAVQTLDLCIGAQVMLLFNLDLQAGLANGSRGVVIGFTNGLPIVRFMNGLETPIDRVSWSMKVAEGIIVSRKQIPLLLAWATTIHKSQGSTLDCAQIDLGATIFEYGQAYTALSRCKSLDSLSIVTFDPSRLVASPYVIAFYNKVGDKLPDIKEDDNVGISDEKLCPICYERETDSIFIPCGHVYCCLECSYVVDPCPVCRSDITMRNKIHIAN